jgi:hypothetical protein
MLFRRVALLIVLNVTALACSARLFANAIVETGTQGITRIATTDLDFNFAAPENSPFLFAAYGKSGLLNPSASTVTGSAGTFTADYAGKITVSVEWSAASNRLYADVTIANHLPEVILEYNLQLAQLRFPTAVTANDGNPLLRAYNTGSPGIFFANYAGAKPGAIACDIEETDVTKPLLMTLVRAGAADTQGALVVMNHHDYQTGGGPFPQWPVPAGATVHFRIALRFVPPQSDPNIVCADLFAAFANRYPVLPSITNWKDRRPIAQVFFESDNTNGGRNPRKWFDPGEHIDITTSDGVKHFQKLVMQRAHDALAHMKTMNAQGIITWDAEGAEFPGATYMGDPEKLATPNLTQNPTQSVAPEMAAIIDQYFKLFRDAGYRVGLTIRPQKVIIQRDPAGHVTLAWETDEGWDWKTAPPADIQDFWFNQLEGKIRFARQRWGATLFYIDSNGDPGSPVSFLVMRRLAAEFPDVLLIPEQSTMGYYSAAAPYRQLNMLAPWNITSPVIRRTWPGEGTGSPCFSVINPTIESMTTSWPDLVREIRAGDILLFRAWYDAPELPAIRRAYAEARKTAQ